MSLWAHTIVYVLVLIAVLAVVAGIMYTVARRWKPPAEEPQSRVNRAYQDALGQQPGTQRTA